MGTVRPPPVAARVQPAWRYRAMGHRVAVIAADHPSGCGDATGSVSDGMFSKPWFLA